MDLYDSSRQTASHSHEKPLLLVIGGWLTSLPMPGSTSAVQ